MKIFKKREKQEEQEVSSYDFNQQLGSFKLLTSVS